MAHVRKVARASGKVAWRACVTSPEGKRRSKTFELKRDAEAWARAEVSVSTSGSATTDLRELARSHNRWFWGLVRSGERSRRTSDGYETHLHVHLAADPELAQRRLSQLSAPAIQAFLDRLIAKTGSVETARRVKKTMSAWCAYGVRNGLLTHNPVDSCKVYQKRRRAQSRLEIPTKATLRSLLAASETGPHAERDRAVLHLLMFGGLRFSELLGLADDAVELSRSPGGGGVICVRERLCSRHVELGELKSADGYREIPIGPAAAAALRVWRTFRGPSPGGVVLGTRIPGRLFPPPPGNSYGPFWAYQDFRRQCWWPLMLRAGVGRLEPDPRGVLRPRVDFSPHALRHVYASIQIEQQVSPKRLQKLLGHATLAMTMDLYGHLWSDPEGDQALAAAAERAFQGP